MTVRWAMGALGLAVCLTLLVGAGWQVATSDVVESPERGRVECVVTEAGDAERVRILGPDAAVGVGRVYLDPSGCIEGDRFVRYINAPRPSR